MEMSPCKVCTLHLEPYTLHPTPYGQNPTPYTIHPTPFALNTPCTLYPTPYSLHPAPFTLHTPYTCNSCSLNPAPQQVTWEFLERSSETWVAFPDKATTDLEHVCACRGSGKLQAPTPRETVLC
jgi:hypothetical protein